MPRRQPGPDDARPIPQPIPQPTPQRPGQAADDEAYVFDVRGRRPSQAPAVPASAAAQPVDYDEYGVPRPSRGPGGGDGGRGPSGRPGPQRGAIPPRRRRPRWGRLLLLLVVLWLAFLVLTPLHAWSTVAKVDAAPPGARPADTSGYNYLLVGSDSREGLTAAQRKEYATGNAAGRRTDSIILVHVSSSGGKPALISIPRDSYVPIPGYGSNKINAAFAFGGPKLLVHTVEQATDLRIDGYVEIGFAGFASVVDSLGGVDICVKFPMNDKKAGINLKKGCQTLDGKNALGYVRARYSDPRGDIGRAERQRQFLAAIMKKAATPSTVLVPTRYWGFTHSAAHGLVVGDDTSIRDASRVLLALRAVSNDAGLSLVVPIASSNYQTSAGSAVKWDTQRARSLFSLLRSDQPLTEPPPGTDGKPSGG